MMSRENDRLLGRCVAEIDQKFQMCLLHTVTLKMEALSTPEMSVDFYETTWHDITEGSHLCKTMRT